MKLKLARRVENNDTKKEVQNMDKGLFDGENWEEDMIQHSADDEEKKGDRDMEAQKKRELTDEELAEQARIKMGNLDLVKDKGSFPSLSNSLNHDKLNNEDDQINKEEFNSTFTEKQKKKEANKLKKELKARLAKLNNAEKWCFDNTIEICRNNEVVKYQTIANAEFLSNLLDRKIAVYVGDLQRGWRKNSKNELVEVRSEKQIKLILDSLLHNRMHGGFITLNLNPNEGYEIDFNEDDHTISGSINQKLQILDGNHRLNAFSRWSKLYRRNPESVPNPAEYYISVIIETLPEDEAKSLFSEYATKSLKINRSRGEYLNVEDNTNKLCREIMKKSDIKVEVISTSIKANSENIITFGVLSKNIKDNFAPSTKKEIEELSDYLTTFVDTLIEAFPEFMASKNLENRAELRKQFLTMEALSWSGFFKISKVIQGKDINLKNLLNKFNAVIEYKGWKGKFLDKSNPIFRKIMREGNKIINTSSSATWVNKVFVEYVVEGKSLEEIGKDEK